MMINFGAGRLEPHRSSSFGVFSVRLFAKIAVLSSATWFAKTSVVQDSTASRIAPATVETRISQAFHDAKHQPGRPSESNPLKSLLAFAY